MTVDTPGWDSMGRGPAGAAAGADPIDEIVSRALDNPDGRALIEALRKRHFDAAINPEASEAALRVRVVRQLFVRDIERSMERHAARVLNRAKHPPSHT